MGNYYAYSIRVFKFQNGGTHDSNYIDLSNQTRNFSVRTGIGRVKDTFDFVLHNPNNRCHETYHSGNGSDKSFVWYWGNFPEGYSKKLSVYVDDVLTSNYTISGDTITFNTAPSLGINNIKIKYPIVEYEDKIEIYQKKNSSSFVEDDLVISGLVNDINGDSSYSDLNLKVSGVGLIEIFFNTLSFVKSYEDEETRTTTAPKIIQDVINQVNELNKDRVVSWAGNTTPSGGGSFPQITYYSTYKRALDIIEDVSSDTHTNDGNYYYYVKYDKSSNTYKFYWKPKKLVSLVADLVEGTDDINDLKFDLNDDDVVNAVIYNCGLDPAGHGMEFLYLSTESSVFNGGGGTHWKYLTTTTHIGDEILNQEFQQQSSNWDTTEEGFRSGSYPSASSYPYTFTFDDRDPTTLAPTGTAATANDDNEFIDAVRLEAKGRGRSWAKRVVDLYSQARNSFKIRMPFNTATTITPGDVIEFTSEKFNNESTKLRVESITYEKGIMIITVIQDEVLL